MKTQTIKLHIHEEAELFSPLDPDGKTLSEDVVSYLSRSFQNAHRSNRENYVIQIDADTPVDSENVEQKIREYFCQDRDTIRHGLKELAQKAICLGIFGVLVLSVWFYLSADAANVNLEILSIVGWVAIWEAASITLMGRRELRQIKKNFDKLIDAEIVITEHTK